MASPRLFTPRNLSLLSIIALSGSYIGLRPKALTVKPRENGDYSVTVDRSGGGI